jgi:hypothetical protein
VDVGHARRTIGLAITAGVVVLAVVGYTGFKLTDQVGHSAETTPQAPQTSQAPRPAPRPAGTPSTSPVAPASASTPVTQVSASPQPVPLTPAKVESFGPSGTADGDNPQLAPNVLTDPAAGWSTHWYASAAFGELKSGTGLLLDMGSTVTLTRVTVQLGPRPGAILELRVAQRPGLAALRGVLGTVTATSATATFTLATPVQARYVLLWCTRLPPSGTGTYQLFVHRVTVEGRP